MEILLKVLLVIFSIALIAIVLCKKGKARVFPGPSPVARNIYSVKRKHAAWISCCSA